jgi:site-specific DNA-methyltransferase (adenine-specific)
MDVLWRMGQRLEEAGFRVDFSFISWVQAQGFPKSQNMSKVIDRKYGARREVIGIKRNPFTITGRAESPDYGEYGLQEDENGYRFTEITSPATEQAKIFDGAYEGSSLKPALECIIVAMRPLETKTYVDQALKNGKGVTWLDSCRIPYQSDKDKAKAEIGEHAFSGKLSNNLTMNPSPTVRYEGSHVNQDGRFPANLLVSDNCLDNGIITGDKTPGFDPVGREKQGNVYGKYNGLKEQKRKRIVDQGDFSRYFSLDAWWSKKLQELPPEQQKTFPFLITPKPSKSEKNKYIENKHPTVKPLKLMSYLITMGSREGDVILDPYAGSGTTLEACRLLNRTFIGIDKDPSNEPLMRARGQLDTPTLDAFEEVA